MYNSFISILSIALFCDICLSNEELTFEEGHDWSYNGAMLDPNHWYVKYETCGGHQQSPIEIDVANVVLDESLGRLQFSGYSTPIENATLINDGHSIKIEVPARYSLKLTSKSLPGVYKLRQFHFHWGSKDNIGSEHEVNWKRFPLELHFVHALENVSDEKILQTPNGLLVLCVFFETRNTDNPNLQDLIDEMFEVKNETFHKINMNEVDELMPADVSSYITYNGSLTTPPCSEVVDWIIFTHINYLSHRQMEEFRRMKHYFVYHIGNRTKEIEETLIDNDRPLQNVYNRVIRLKKDLGDLIPSASSSSHSPLFLLITIALSFSAVSKVIMYI